MQVLHTNSSRKRRKTPRSPGWKEREAEYQRHLKKLGIDMSVKPKKPKFVPYQPKKSFAQERAMENRDKYPSNTESFNSDACAKIEPMKYKGTLVKGISTMHKSNAVPIINEQEAKEHASMRR